MNDTVMVGVKENEGTMNFQGMEIKLSDIIGDRLVTQYMAQLKDEDLQIVFNKINSMIFKTYKEGDKEYKELKEQYKADTGWGHSEYKETPLWKYIQQQYEKTFIEKIKEEINRRFQEEDFIKKVNEAADQIVEYAVEGYKQDMIARIRERLVGNVLNPGITYGSESLIGIINGEIDKRLHY